AVGSAVRGAPDTVRLALVALLSGGHLLVEGMPGTGKTLLAQSLAVALGGGYGPVQCTPDLAPADVTGTAGCGPAPGVGRCRPRPGALGRSGRPLRAHGARLRARRRRRDTESSGHRSWRVPAGKPRLAARRAGPRDRRGS